MNNDFAKYLTDFLGIYLPGQKNLSENTMLSYRDAFRLILAYARDECGIPPQKFLMKHFTKEFVESFLFWLEDKRHNSIATRNQRLAAIHSFIDYVTANSPELLLQHQQIMAMDFKKYAKHMIRHFSAIAVSTLLSMPNEKTSDSRRDMVLLSLLYDTGARVSEIVNADVGDVRLQKPPLIRLLGKGRKERCVPLMDKSASLLVKYFKEHKLTSCDKNDRPLFLNHRGQRLTRAGITYILKKYAANASETESEFRCKVTPHMLRHSKAMHLQKENIPLVYIRDFLGHAHEDTTEIYARIDTDTKKKVLENAYIDLLPEMNVPDSSWSDDPDLMDWLQDFCIPIKK